MQAPSVFAGTGFEACCGIATSTFRQNFAAGAPATRWVTAVEDRVALPQSNLGASAVNCRAAFLPNA